MADAISPRPEATTRDGRVSRRSCSVIGSTLVLGSALLAATLRVPRGSGWLTALGLLLAATWLVGAGLAGQFPLVPRPWPRPVLSLLVAAGIGGLAFLGFLTAFLLGRNLLFVSGALATVLSKADAGPSGLVVFVALVNGVGEELFFRGALQSFCARRNQILVTTAVYVVVTATTGNVALVIAAAAMGMIFSLERFATRGVVAPIMTHVTWSVLMLIALPR